MGMVLLIMEPLQNVLPLDCVVPKNWMFVLGRKVSGGRKCMCTHMGIPIFVYQSYLSLGTQKSNRIYPHLSQVGNLVPLLGCFSPRARV
jgi:hypothetical protein